MKKQPRFFCRYVHLNVGTIVEGYMSKTLLPFLFRGEKEGYLQILYFKQTGGPVYEIPGRDQQTEKENGYEKAAAK
jgi:hypothetical protein